MSIYKAENQSSQNMKIDDMPFLAKILENIREVIAYDKQQKQPLILRINEAFIFKIARKAILEKNSTFLMSIAGESASGKTTLVKNTAKACIKTDTDNAYTVICCDDYYKDASYFLVEAHMKLQEMKITERDITRKIGYFLEHQPVVSDCAAASLNQLTINTNGDIHACQCYMNQMNTFGSVFDNDLIYDSDRQA